MPVIACMKAPLNFGPSEQTRKQREEIAQRAIALHQAEERQATADLLALYKQYVEGKADLYAISIHLGDQARQRLLSLVEDPSTQQQ